MSKWGCCVATIPEYTRWAWRTAAAKAAWDPQIQTAVDALHRLEWLSVHAGIREAALVDVAAEDLSAFTMTLLRQYDLFVVPLSQHAVPARYGAQLSAPKPGGKTKWRVAVGRSIVGQLHDAYHAHDEDRVGALLGYPACCRAFFQRHWADARRRDVTWEQAQEGRAPDGPPEANILLRWLGVRLVPHLPCAFTCAATVDVGRQWQAVAAQQGIDLTGTRAMLAWPERRSRWHGAAEIVCPDLRISCSTEWTAEKQAFVRAPA